MAPVMVANFDQEFLGAHCGSGALVKLARLNGANLSEPLVFGLGGGLGFSYGQDDANLPSRYFHGRCIELEPTFLRNIGCPGSWRSGPLAWPEVKAALDQDWPVLALTDMSLLPYTSASVPFGGHTITMVGYDPEGPVLLVVDALFSGVHAVPFETLSRAMYSRAAPHPISGHWLPVPPFVVPPDLPAVLRRAIWEGARAYLKPAIPSTGLEGLRVMATALPDWGRLPDWLSCVRFCHLVIRGAGAGGMAFRQLQARLYREAQRWVPELPGDDLAAQLDGIAQQWDALAATLRQIARRESPAGLDEAAAMLWEIGEQEERFFRQFI